MQHAIVLFKSARTSKVQYINNLTENVLAQDVSHTFQCYWQRKKGGCYQLAEDKKRFSFRSIVAWIILEIVSSRSTADVLTRRRVSHDGGSLVRRRRQVHTRLLLPLITCTPLYSRPRHRPCPVGFPGLTGLATCLAQAQPD